ncbi:peptide chain release factor 1 [Puniceicoccales bacterium CK1056]|uniref:Peptide chain release factor 1 n=1 Tax=Oceanipulchritudo coccoides TaxID=2706888 RepID=A0A6B2M0Y4_9BACT|nr:peptide chain release factor 1 [Oceanipulchritudo coccoides]NDV61979.1 peptide chain release factor 1 [Oceanipulchritudo coccoides]
MPELPDLNPFVDRLADLDRQMAEPDFFSDPRKSADLSREHQKLTRLLELRDRFMAAGKQLEENKELMADTEADEELREMAAEEVPQLEEQLEKLYEEVLESMLPPDPSDSRNTIMEIRAGTGGDEASLFAGDLFRMYSRFAERQGWRIEELSSNESEVGGFKEIIFSVSGDSVYRDLKWESGVHRVQRVPTTEAGGRIHTSAATVAVLPEAEEVDVQIDPSELEITVARASGPGGQGVNTTDSAVQILHKPTGMIVKCADERSQLKNKNKAMKVLRSRLLEQKEREEQEKYAANRKSQVGSGDRSERIRTYNFPQGRMTDHRINLTLYSLDELMEGGLSPVVEGLQEADKKQRIEAILDTSSAN